MVAIKGFEIPKTCVDCKLSYLRYGKFPFCAAMNQYIDDEYYTEIKSASCPLYEVEDVYRDPELDNINV